MNKFKHCEKGDIKVYFAQLIEMYKSYNCYTELDESFLRANKVKRYGRLDKLPSNLYCRFSTEGDNIAVEELRVGKDGELFELNDTVVLVKSEVDQETVVVYTLEEFNEAFGIDAKFMALTFKPRIQEGIEALDVHFNGAFLFTLFGNHALPINFGEVKKLAKPIFEKLEDELTTLTIPFEQKVKRLSENLHHNFRIYRSHKQEGANFNVYSMICPYLRWGLQGTKTVFELMKMEGINLPFNSGVVYVFEGDKDHFAQLINTYMMFSGMVD